MNRFLKYSLFLIYHISTAASSITFIDEVYDEAYNSGAIIGYMDEKVYLNSSNLIVDEGDWLLDLCDDNYALLPQVYIDGNGYFIPSFEDSNRDIMNCRYAKVTNTCPDCHKESVLNCRTPKCKENLENKLKAYKAERDRKTKAYNEKKSRESEEKKAQKKEQKENAKRIKAEQKSNKKIKV